MSEWPRVRAALHDFRCAIEQHISPSVAWVRVIEAVEMELAESLQPGETLAALVVAYGDACAAPNGKRLEAEAALLAEVARLRERTSVAETARDEARGSLELTLKERAREQDRLFANANAALNEAYRTADHEWHKTADKLNTAINERDEISVRLARTQAQLDAFLDHMTTGEALDTALVALALRDGEDVPGFLLKRGYTSLSEYRKLHDTPPAVHCLGHGRHERTEVPFKKVWNGMDYDWRGACPRCGNRFLTAPSKDDHAPGVVTFCPDADR